MSLPSLRFPGLLRYYEHSESWCSALRPSEGMNSVCCATTISLLISSTLPSILSPTTRVRDVWLFLIVRVFPSAITPWRLTQIPFRIRSFFRTQNLAHHFIHSSADSRRPEPNRVHARITPAIHFCYRLDVHFQLLSTVASLRRSYFQSPADELPPDRDFHPAVLTPSQAH